MRTLKPTCNTPGVRLTKAEVELKEIRRELDGLIRGMGDFADWANRNNMSHMEALDDVLIGIDWLMDWSV